MISEGSCDTESWSNDAENSALNHTFYNIFKAKAAILNHKNIHNIIAFAVFWVK